MGLYFQHVVQHQQLCKTPVAYWNQVTVLHVGSAEFITIFAARW